MSEKKKKVLLVTLCAICFLQPAIAQRITRQYNNVSFSAALKDLNAAQDKYAINFVYDELEDFKVSKSIRNMSVPDAILQLIGFLTHEGFQTQVQGAERCWHGYRPFEASAKGTCR